jgi:hypothetical protein
MSEVANHLAFGLQIAAQPANLLFCFLGVLFGRIPVWRLDDLHSGQGAG